MLGGINRMLFILLTAPADVLLVVDVLPWRPEGNYSHTLVENNLIYGGFATEVGVHAPIVYGGVGGGIADGE